MRRDRPRWFNSASEPILEICLEAGIPLTRTTIIGAILLENSQPPSDNTIRSGVDRLADHGFLEMHTAGYNEIELYQLTPKARQWLDGHDLASIDTDN